MTRPLAHRVAAKVAGVLPRSMTVGDMYAWLQHAGGFAQLDQRIDGSERLLHLDARLEARPFAWPADLLDVDARAVANLVAMWTMAGLPHVDARTNAERLLLASYTGWGGIGSHKRYAASFPPGYPVPEARGLLHEYYTPSKVWAAVAVALARFRDQLPRDGAGNVSALEPSAGIGRALRVFTPATGWPEGLRWTALEASRVSARLLRALNVADEVFEGFAESWIAEHSHRRFSLVLSNPPYGARGEAKELDANGFNTKQAYVYFTVRTAELLAEKGIGVYIIPTGLLTSRTAVLERAREALLKRAHLLGAFRLPSMPPEGGTLADVAYENFVVDVLFVQGRGGIADVLPASDRGIVEGEYYTQHPRHVLGTPIGELAGDEDSPVLPTGGRVRRGFQIVGTFAGFPAWTPRPVEAVEVRAAKAAKPSRGGIVRQEQGELGDDVPFRLRSAVQLGVRADRYLAELARNERPGGRAELVRDLEAWASAHGDPGKDEGLKALAVNQTGAQRFAALWTRGRLLPALQADPPIEGFRVPPGTDERSAIVQTATHLFKQRGGLPLDVDDVARACRGEDLRGPVPSATPGTVLKALVHGGWCVDELPAGVRVEPPEHYYTGFLWPKYDRAKAGKDAWSRNQAAELRRRIGWKGGAEFLKETAPNQPWVPEPVLRAWAASAVRWPSSIAFVWRDGLIQPENVVGYGGLVNTDKERTAPFDRLQLCLVGWINQNKTMFSPPREKERDDQGNERDIPADVLRRKLEAQWLKHWQEWLQRNDRPVELLEEAFNRRVRGYIPPTWPTEPIEVARWTKEDGPKAVRLHGYQNAGEHQLLANGCGLLAFDVGLGKTYTGIQTIAKMREEGRARRPVVLVPNTIAWKWVRDFAKCLPDYRVLVLGSNRKVATSGARRGKWVAAIDTPEERAKKWTEFQAGLWDVVVVTYSAFARQQISRELVDRYVSKTVAIRRAITLALEDAELHEGKAKGKAKRTERKEADTQERARAWAGDMLAPPKNWRYDEGIDWHALGIDLLVVDEAQNFKNLFFSAREGSAERQAAKRAWALDFRCASVREHAGGGGGVILLSATPMKNAATEFYNLLHLVNPAVWEQVGLSDPESFINMFARIEEKEVSDGEGKRVKRQLVTGFNHQDVLKSVVYRWATFKNAQQVGLPLPEVKRVQHIVRASDEQDAVFAELFSELADNAEKIKNILRASGGGKDPKWAGVLRGLRQKKQGITARLYLAALHPGLVGGSQVASAGPKLVEAANTIAKTKPTTCSTTKAGEPWCLTCGHIVFVDNIAVHGWLRELLVERGVPRERIAILNAHEAADIELRQQIAEGFNGAGEPGDEVYNPPVFDVVIANAVAYEGIDLQRRTCAIHHLDVPWEPATLQQRNGRGVRQGAKFADIALHFYFVKGSTEANRLDKIERKRGIMVALYEEGDLKTNSVTADEIEGDEEDTDAFLNFAPPHLREKIKAAAEEERKERIAEGERRARKAANTALKDALQAERRARRGSDDALKAAELHDQARTAWDGLARFPAALWPFDWHMADARAGKLDVVAVWRFDRFARNTRHLLGSMEEFKAVGVDFVSLREQVDTSTPLGRAMFTILSAISELERDIIRERVLAGVRRAQASGKHCGRPRKDLDLRPALALLNEGRGLKDVARILKVPRATLRRRLDEAGRWPVDRAAA